MNIQNSCPPPKLSFLLYPTNSINNLGKHFFLIIQFKKHSRNERLQKPKNSSTGQLQTITRKMRRPHLKKNSLAIHKTT